MERSGGGAPIVFLVDTAASPWRVATSCSASMRISPISQCLLLASREGHPRSAYLRRGGGRRFIATALVDAVLVALPGAEPAVMDLPAMARVTKLPLEQLEELAKRRPSSRPASTADRNWRA